MTPPNDQSPISQPPKEFFDDASFKTLYGGVVVTWVATSAIADVLGDGIDLKMLGFIVALTVAFVGFFLSEQRNMKKLVITPFNGLLIYLTIMGGTSFLPADIEDRQVTAGPDTTQTEVTEPGESIPVSQSSAFLRAWNPDRDLVEKTNTLQQENVQLEVRTKQLQQVNQTYETKLDSTRQVIQTLQVSPEIRENLMRTLDVNATQNFELRDNSLINN
ncbi:MAG: hypothetical protein U5K72_14865 [Balneolaceae bacterium]|nr:hypothetical protein [Balneolaceae bacterium]